MKKIITILLAVVLVFSLCAMPTSAATSKSDWQKMTGPGKILLTEEGIKCQLEDGQTFFKYTKETFNVLDFTCTFIPHYTEKANSFFTVMLNGCKGYTGAGAQGLFLVMRIKEDGKVNMNGQILHTGYHLTEPKYKDLAVDTSKPLVLKGKDNGNGTYTVSFEGSPDEYTFDIPENYQFTKDLNGQGYFTFGGSLDEGDAPRAITVVSVNGVDFSGNKPEPESSSKPTSSSTGSSDDTTDGGNTIIGDDSNIIGGDNTTTTTDGEVEEASSNAPLLIVIIICGVLVLGAIAAVVVVLIKKKSTTVETEEVSEETAE